MTEEERIAYFDATTVCAELSRRGEIMRDDLQEAVARLSAFDAAPPYDDELTPEENTAIQDAERASLKASCDRIVAEVFRERDRPGRGVQANELAQDLTSNDFAARQDAELARDLDVLEWQMGYWERIAG